MTTILTPVTLWKDFDDTLPLNEVTLSETHCGNAVVRDVFFDGRQTEKGRVKIYAQYVYPADKKEFPAVMVLFEAGLAPDMRFVRRFVSKGYGVLCVDYCGENGTKKHTYYPEDVDYGNYIRAGRAMYYAEPTARETSWFEWSGVARYAARYLSARPEVVSVGAIGLRTGGEILFKVAPYAPISCMISVCAAGWLAYRGIEKYGDEKQREFDEERHRFIAGIDSQSYAPYVKCPVLLISAINDKKYNYDRVFDTYRQINPEVYKAILFSSHGNGLVGMHSLTDIELFLDKYLKDRQVYLSTPISFTVGEDDKGDLIVTGKNDPAGDLVECGYFYTEKVSAFRTRDWTRVLIKGDEVQGDNLAVAPLGVYTGSDRVLLYTFAHYSNGFSVTSRIQEFNISKRYNNSSPKCRVIYTADRDELNGFTALNEKRCVADCFADGKSDVWIARGYGGIEGISSSGEIISYRVGEPRYEAQEGCSLALDLYSKEDAEVKITFFKDEEEQSGYSCVLKLEGGGKWKNFVLDADDFKSESSGTLDSFRGLVSVVFRLGDGIVLNNVVWL